MKTTWTSSFLAALIFIACSPSQKVTSSWTSKENSPEKPYQSLFIAVLTDNQAAKATIESDIAAAATARGLKAVKSGDVFAPNFTRQPGPSRTEMMEKIRQQGCDGIFTLAVLDKQSETRYVPGSVNYSPFMGYSGGFYGYYSYWQPTLYSPGYYTTDKTYFFEANLFDASNEQLVWSMQSEAYNPNKISKFSRDYTQLLVGKMKTDLAKK